MLCSWIFARFSFNIRPNEISLLPLCKAVLMKEFDYNKKITRVTAIHYFRFTFTLRESVKAGLYCLRWSLPVHAERFGTFGAWSWRLFRLFSAKSPGAVGRWSTFVEIMINPRQRSTLHAQSLHTCARRVGYTRCFVSFSFVISVSKCIKNTLS